MKVAPVSPTEPVHSGDGGQMLALGLDVLAPSN